MKNLFSREELKWQVIDRKAVFHSPIFTLFRSRRQLPSKQAAGDFYYLDSKDWVTVIPLIRLARQYEVILVEQFRHGSEQLVLEFPAGVIDSGEEPRSCALRELVEETGYHKILHCEQLGVSYPNPAIMSNQTFTYAAVLDDLQREPQLDEMEALLIHRVPLASLKQLVFKKGSPFNSALMLQAMFWLENSKLFSQLPS